MALDQASFTINDYDGQQGSFAVNSTILTAANFDAQETARETLFNTLNAIIDGIAISHGVSHRAQVAASTTKSGDPEAQRGNKWQVHCYDNTQDLAVGVENPYYKRPFTYEIPTANLQLRQDNSNIVWTNGGTNNVAAFDPFVAAFEAYAKSPVGGVLNVEYIEAITAGGG